MKYLPLIRIVGHGYCSGDMRHAQLLHTGQARCRTLPLWTVPCGLAPRQEIDVLAQAADTAGPPVHPGCPGRADRAPVSY